MKKYMLKLIVIAVVVTTAFTTSRAQAQTNDYIWSFGLEAGPSFSKYGQDANNSEFKTGFVLGANLNYSIRNTYGFTTKLLYTQRGAKEGNVKQTLNYVEVPMVGRIFFNRTGKFRPNLFAGPSFAFLTSAKSKTGDAERVNIANYESIYKTFDLGLTGGLGLNYEIMPDTRILVDFRYTHGLTDISETNSSTVNNKNIAITAGFSIGI